MKHHILLIFCAIATSSHYIPLHADQEEDKLLASLNLSPALFESNMACGQETSSSSSKELRGFTDSINREALVTFMAALKEAIIEHKALITQAQAHKDPLVIRFAKDQQHRFHIVIEPERAIITVSAIAIVSGAAFCFGIAGALVALKVMHKLSEISKTS